MKWSSIIAIISTIINILLSGIVCYVLFVIVPCYNSLCADDLIDYLGIFIACISIVITGYFAVLAINAYARIEKTKQDAKEIAKARNEAETHLMNIGGITKTIYEVAIDMVEMSGRSNKDEKSQNIIKKRRKNLYRDYNRLGLNPFLLSNEERMSFIRNLRSFAQEEDIEELEKICKSKTESPEIKRVAKEVLDSFNSSKPTIIHQSICERIKSRLNTFFNGQCELFKELIRG